MLTVRIRTLNSFYAVHFQFQTMASNDTAVRLVKNISCSISFTGEKSRNKNVSFLSLSKREKIAPQNKLRIVSYRFLFTVHWSWISISFGDNFNVLDVADKISSFTQSEINTKLIPLSISSSIHR